MARTTKASTRGPAGKAKQTSGTGKAAGSGKARANKGAANTEVERRWANYLEQRAALEQAVDSVRVAVEQLSSARALEASHRKQFDESKQALEQLLEVDAASPAQSRPSPAQKPHELASPQRPPAARVDKEAKPG